MDIFSLNYIVAGVAVLAITAYGLLAGADFGGGILDLFARGSRAKEQRKAITTAIGPVWETNHIWLILLVVLLFTCFPTAFAALSIALSIPFTLVLVGIVLRGTSFVFRAHAQHAERTQRILGVIFAVASTITPGLLGTCVGAISTGELEVMNGQVNTYMAWLGLFALSCGALAQSLCIYLASVYLSVVTEGDKPVQEDFRRRAFIAGGAVVFFATITLILTPFKAPHLWGNLTRLYVLPLLIGGGVFALASLWSLWSRHFSLTRIFAAGQVTLIFWGWAAAQAPYIIYSRNLAGAISLDSAAAPEATLRDFLLVLLGGSVFLIPSLGLLFATFGGKNPVELEE